MSILSINPVRGPWVAAAGRPCHILYPDPKVFEDVEQVAFALSYQNRYNGWYGPYSVAQHAVLVSNICEKLGGSLAEQLAALHHDDAEMILGDVPEPVKRLCPGFLELSRKWELAVNVCHQLDILAKPVRIADHTMFLAETELLVPEDQRWMYKQLLNGEIRDWPESGLTFHGRTFPELWDPKLCQTAYVNRHESLLQDFFYQLGMQRSAGEA